MDMRRPTIALLCAAAAAWPAGARGEVPSAPPRAGYRAGEGFAFTFSVGAIQAGRARISVGAPSETKNGRLVAVQADAHSAPWLALIAHLDDEYKTLLDVDALATRTVKAIERGVRERRLDMALQRAGGATRIELDVVRPKQERHEIRFLPGAPLDPVAALFTMRAAPLRDGDRLQFIAFDGPAFYRVEVRVAAHEAIERLGGKTGAIRLELTAHRVDDRGRDVGHPRRYATVWLSDDEKRIPYRVGGDTDFGRCELELAGYREGSPPPPRRGATRTIPAPMHLRLPPPYDAER